jgi:hypothetical protein
MLHISPGVDSAAFPLLTFAIWCFLLRHDCVVFGGFSPFANAAARISLGFALRPSIHHAAVSIPLHNQR